MNVVVISGNVVRDPELKTGKVSVVRFSVACQRRFKNAEGNYDADFPNIVAFDKTAEFIAKHFKKGDRIEVSGHLQTGNYKKDGVTIYTTDVIVDQAGFGGKAGAGGGSRSTEPDFKANNDEDEEEENALPFEL